MGFLWRNVHGKWPANNIKFRRACAALYAEAGGGETDAEPKDGFWRDHRRKAEPWWQQWEKNLPPRPRLPRPRVLEDPAEIRRRVDPFESPFRRRVPLDDFEPRRPIPRPVAEASLRRADPLVELAALLGLQKYYPLLERAVLGLEKNNGENRRALYERARAALLAQLGGHTPTLDEYDIIRERLALEEAIRKVEAESARAFPRGEKK